MGIVLANSYLVIALHNTYHAVAHLDHALSIKSAFAVTARCTH